MRHYCTLFDRNYIDRGLALYRSLERHCGNFKLYVLCLDSPTREGLSELALSHVEPVELTDLLDWDRDLIKARAGRTAVEFYFTCKPVLLSYLLRDASIARLDYLDSDIWFFAAPELMETAYQGSSVALSPHRFDSRNTERRRYGLFNAGWVSVDAGQEGRRFVSWWRDLCVEWCRMDVEETRFGDQKYLDRVPSTFPAAKTFTHPGVNLGPWNIGGVRVERHGDAITVDGEPLVFFHFHGMRRMLFKLHESGLHDYGVALTPVIRDGIYRPYVSELDACVRQLAQLPSTVRARLAPEPVQLSRRLVRTLRALARHTVVTA